MLIVTAAIIGVLCLTLYVYSSTTVRRSEAMFPPRGEFLEVEGTTLHYIRKGEGKPVVFLHGGILWADDFSEVIERAAEQYCAIAFDRPGYGYSKRPRTDENPLRYQAQLLHKALQKLNANKPILVAHSMSGAVALSYAVRYPDDLSGLVLVGAAGYGGKAYPAGKDGKGDFLSRLIMTPLAGDLFLHTMLVPLGKIALKPMVKATFAPDPVPENYLKAAGALWIRPGQFRANREDVLAFHSAVEPLTKHYKEIDLPVKVVVGERDPFNSDQQSYQLHSDIPTSDLTVIKDAGHMIPQVRPDAVLDAVQEVAGR